MADVGTDRHCPSHSTSGHVHSSYDCGVRKERLSRDPVPPYKACVLHSYGVATFGVNAKAGSSVTDVTMMAVVGGGTVLHMA